MRPFFTVQDVETIGFIPREELGHLALEMDNILKAKVAKLDDNDKAWNLFLDTQDARRTGSAPIASKVEVKRDMEVKHAPPVVHPTKKTTSHEKRIHN